MQAYMQKKSGSYAKGGKMLMSLIVGIALVTGLISNTYAVRVSHYFDNPQYVKAKTFCTGDWEPWLKTHIYANNRGWNGQSSNYDYAEWDLTGGSPTLINIWYFDNDYTNGKVREVGDYFNDPNDLHEVWFYPYDYDAGQDRCLVWGLNADVQVGAVWQNSLHYTRDYGQTSFWGYNWTKLQAKYDTFPLPPTYYCSNRTMEDVICLTNIQGFDAGGGNYKWIRTDLYCAKGYGVIRRDYYYPLISASLPLSGWTNQFYNYVDGIQTPDGNWHCIGQ